MNPEIFGIEVFRAELPQLNGTIKLSAEDFEVREVNLRGELAGLNERDDVTIDEMVSKVKRIDSKQNQAAIFPENPDKKESVLSDHSEVDISEWGLNISPMPTSSEKDKSEKKKTSNISREPDWFQISKNPAEYLKSILSEKAWNDLQNFIENKESELRVGVYNDKTLRTMLHQCVRYCYPSLLSKTMKDNKNVHFVCAADPLYKEFSALVNGDEQICDLLFKFIYCRPNWGVTNTYENDSCLINVGNMSKDNRRAIHFFLGKFSKILSTKTIFNTAAQVISVRFKPKKVQEVGCKRKIKKLHRLVLFKEICEFVYVLQQLAFKLNVEFSNIKYAGMKDKKACTYQYITVSDVSRDVLECVMKLPTRSWKISHPVTVEKHLQTGELRGNIFKLNVRNIKFKGMFCFFVLMVE